MKTYPSIAAYIKAQPKIAQVKLLEMQALVEKAAPKATPAIKYGMPTYAGTENLVHFAAMKGHFGVYPTPSAIDNFASELASYNTSKGCIRFPYDQPLPRALITKIVKFRVAEDKKQST